MNKINFLAGNEAKAIGFLENISSKDRVAILSHTDLDGIVSAKVVSMYVKPKLLLFLDYEDLRNGLSDKLRKNKINKVIISDLSINDIYVLRKINKFAEILIIDHHEFKHDFNDAKTIFMNAKGYCAAYLCYYIISKIKDISEIDWIVACSSISDFQYFNNTEFMEKTLSKYGDKFEVKGDYIRKDGKFWDLQYSLSLAIVYFKSKNKLEKVYSSIGKKFEDVGDLMKHSKIIQDEIDRNIEKFWKQKESFNDIYLWYFKQKFPVSSILINIISVKEPSKTFILIRVEGKYLHISTRRQDGKVDLPVLLKKATKGLKDADGGGHRKAAGAIILLKDLGKFKENLKKLS